MRSDFIKVLTERPRDGGRRGKGYRKARQRQNEANYAWRAGDDPAPGCKQGMRRPYKVSGGCKRFTDVLGPLVRFLHSRVGKPWSEVHSEICAQLKGRSTQQQHLLDHLNQMVVTDLAWENGKLVHANGTPFLTRSDFYVDPRDGTLRPVPKKYTFRHYWRTTQANIEAESKKDELKTKTGQVFRRIDGIWYEITARTEPSPIYADFSKTVVSKYVDINTEHKRQLGTAELKQRGLSNDAESWLR